MPEGRCRERKVLGRMMNDRAKKRAGYAFFLLLLLYSGLMMDFFYRETIPQDGVFYSDMGVYIQETMGVTGGLVPYRLFFWVSRIWAVFVSPAAAVAFTTMLCNSAAVALTKYYFDKILRKELEKEGLGYGTAWEMLTILSVFALFFVSMVYSPRGTAFFGFDYTYRCQGILTPNPYWNATYLAVRPLTIPTFFIGAELLEELGKGIAAGKAAAFGVLVFLGTFTKPSFTFILIPVGGAVLLWRLCVSRGAAWRDALALCLSLVPTGILLLYEFFCVFVQTNAGAEEAGMGVELFKAWHLYSNNIPLSIVMAMAFPIAALALNISELKRSICFRLSWLLWLAGFLTFALCYEKGYRFSHMNFSWGYMHGLFFVFMLSILQLLKNVVRKGSVLQKLRILPEAGLLAFHLVCGIVFFVYLYQGNNMAWF